MRKLLLIGTILLMAQILFGQNKLNEKNISFGLQHHQGFPDAIKKYFTVNDVLLSVCLYRETIILQTFSHDSLSIIKSRDFQGFPKKVQVEDVLQFNNEVYLLYSSLVDNDTVYKESLYIRKINVDSCSFEKSELLMSVDGNVTAILSRHDHYDNFDFCSTIDQDRFVVQYKRKKGLKKPIEIGYKVFDRDFNLIWEKEIEMPYNGKQMETIDFAIDAQSNVYLASYIYRDKVSNLFKDNSATARRVNGRGEINCDLEIFKMGITTGSYTKLKIALDSGYHINSFKFFPINNEQLIVAGYSSAIGRNSKFYQVSGVFKFNILDKERKIDAFSIPTDVVNQNLKKSQVSLNTTLKRRYGKHWKPTMEFLVPEHLILDKDGGMILIGEQNIPIERHYGTMIPIGGLAIGSGFMMTSAHMRYNDVLISKFTKDGSLSWIKKLAKRQETTNRIDFFGLHKRGLSYRLIEGEDDLYILYMDQFKNLTLPSTKKPAELNDNGDHGFLTAFKINRSSGAGSKAAILDVRKINGFSTKKFNIASITSFQKDEFIFEGYYSNLDRETASLRLSRDLGFLTLINFK